MSSRFEQLTKALANGETVSFKPHSRLESYLIHCIEGGDTENLPDPISRTDVLLRQLVDDLEGGIPGTGGSGVPTEEVATDEEVHIVLEDVFKPKDSGEV